MVSSFNFSNIISEKHQNESIKLVDTLIREGNWDKSSPSFQTFPNLHFYQEFHIFLQSFLNACNAYKNNSLNPVNIKMWCYVDNGSNFFKTKSHLHNNLWHTHQQNSSFEGLSGVYYLKNDKKLATEFKSFEIKIPEDFTWYIFPSRLEHRSPKITSITKRYTIAADLFF